MTSLKLNIRDGVNSSLLKSEVIKNVLSVEVPEGRCVWLVNGVPMVNVYVETDEVTFSFETGLVAVFVVKKSGDALTC
jgi:hypothetical protein